MSLNGWMIEKNGRKRKAQRRKTIEMAGESRKMKMERLMVLQPFLLRDLRLPYGHYGGGVYEVPPHSHTLYLNESM
jgi:hypothetical protein